MVVNDTANVLHVCDKTLGIGYLIKSDLTLDLYHTNDTKLKCCRNMKS